MARLVLILSSWSSLDVTVGDASGNTSILVTGSGFSPDEPYLCHFDAAISLAVPAVYVSVELIVCEARFWDSFAQIANFSLTASGTLITPLNSTFTAFEFLDGWASFAPSASAASGGDVVTVSGFGLDVAASEGYYQCVWSLADASFDPVRSANVSQFKNASVSSSTELLCSTPAWGLTQNV
eukprot:1135477-Rhodomonas_salina.1